MLETRASGSFILSHAMQNLERLKESPKSQEAEQSVLGGLLLDCERWEEISRLLHVGDFFYMNNRTIFQAISELVLKDQGKFDITTLIAHLRNQDKLEDAGGVDYLNKLSIETLSASNIRVYAEIVREESVKRQLISASNEIADSAYFPDGKDGKKLLELAEQKIFSLNEAYRNNAQTGLMPVQPILSETLEYIQQMASSGERIIGYKTSFTDLDKKLLGLQKGNLIVVAARPSMGKTTFAMGLAVGVARNHQLPVAFFSLEMPARDLMLRQIASDSAISLGALQIGDISSSDQGGMALAITQINDTKLFIDDDGLLSISDLRNKLAKLRREQGELGLVVIDYLQLMQMPMGKNDNRATQIAELSRALKLLAKEMQVPIIILSQLNRSLESRTDKRPIMSDIRESGAVEQDADVILFIYREEVYKDVADDQKNVAEIIIAKNRNGAIGKAFLRFNGENSRFENLAQGMTPPDGA